MGEVHQRRANLRRVTLLFNAYRWRLATVLALIFTSALLGIVSPFLIRDIFDEALPQDDDRLLTLLVLGLIGIAVVTGVLGVAQATERAKAHQRHRVPPADI